MKHIPMFVFGTLMNKDTLDYLGVEPIETTTAVLEGYRKIGLNIVPDEGSVVHGHYFQINEDELAILDRYESIDSEYGYHRFLINVAVSDQQRRVYAYQIKGTE